MLPEDFVRSWMFAHDLPGQTWNIIELVSAAFNAGQARDEFWSLSVEERDCP
jgi:hypothetical protein